MGTTSGEQKEEKEERQEVEDDDDEEKEEEEEERSGSIDSGYCLTAYLHLICPLGDSQPGPLERKLQNTLANL